MRPVIISLLSILLLFSGCNVTNDNQTPGSPKTRQVQEANTPVPSPAKQEAGIKSGMYKVGQDMPPGEYKLFSTGSLTGLSYFEVAKDSSNKLESIVANDNFDSFTYVTVSEGQYFKFSDSHAVPADQAEKSGPVEGRYAGGMYKVGVDIPAGEYKVFPDEDSTLGYGYYEITTSSRHVLDDIVANDNFEDPRYITVENGQYIKLSEAYIEDGGGTRTQAEE